MKPKIDLNHPLTKIGIELSQRSSIRALEAKQTVESAVIPIYGFRKRKAHQRKPPKAEQIASGVLVKIKDEYFVFSATHVFWDFEDKALITGPMNGNLTEQIAGERFSTGNLEDPKADKYDASVYHIQSKLSDDLKSLAIGLEQFDFTGIDKFKNVFLAAGFRVKKSNTVGQNVYSKREAFPTFEFDEKDYKIYGIDFNSQILLAWEDQVLVNENWQTSPVPKGLSGGAIIKVKGTNLLPVKKAEEKVEQKLSAITIEQHRKKGNKIGHLIGTRINVHLGLIHQFLPGLLDDFLKRMNE